MIIIKDVHLRIALIASFLALLTVFVISYTALADVKHLLIVHYDSYRGIDFLGDKWDVFGILGLAAFLNAINFFLADVFYDRQRFLAHLAAYFSIFLSLLILIAIAAIISIN